MGRLLVVHHTTSPVMEELLEAVLAGTRDSALTDVDVRVRPALTAGPIDVLEAQGYLLGTPANIGYISGALKHFFDTVYYPCRHATAGRGWGAYVRRPTLGLPAMSWAPRWRQRSATPDAVVAGREDRTTVCPAGRRWAPPQSSATIAVASCPGGGIRGLLR